MKRFKNAGFGVLVAGIAFGLSAFTTLKKRSVFVYYKTDMFYPNANDPRGYKYYSGNRCAAGGNLCCAQWELGTNPSPTADGEALPTTGVIFQTGSVVTGHFD
jgi:hypothetical protein